MKTFFVVFVSFCYDELNFIHLWILFLSNYVDFFSSHVAYLFFSVFHAVLVVPTELGKLPSVCNLVLPSAFLLLSFYNGYGLLDLMQSINQSFYNEK